MRQRQTLGRRRWGQRPIDLVRLGHAASALMGVERPRNDGDRIDRPVCGRLRWHGAVVMHRRLPERVRAPYLRVAGRLVA